MLLRKIIGIIIILLNIGGLGFLLYMLTMMLKNKYLGTDTKEEALQNTAAAQTAERAKTQKIKEQDIIPDEDDLLKDMDLSDLDNLNLDDFD